MSKQNSSKRDATKTIRGYIVREDKPTKCDEDYFSDDDDDNFDMSGNYVKRVPLHATKVLVQTLDADDEVSVQSPMSYIYGKFPYLGLWWHVTVDVKMSNDNYYSQGLPSYRLRSDLNNRRDVFNRMISVVLNSEKVSSAQQSVETKVFLSFLHRQQFDDFGCLYRIERLTELLQKCAAELSTPAEQNSVLSLLDHLHNSTELKEINQAMNHPHCMRTLPLLHPRTAHSIIKCGLEEPLFLNKVEEMIAKSPYELAFRCVIKRKTGRVFREVTKQNLEKAGLWAGICQPYKDAVVVYGVLKEHCYGTGDTYMSVHRLNGQTKRYKGYILSAFSEAIDYLKSSGSVVEEDTRIFLKYFYDSENNIADIFSQMILAQKHFTFSTDFTCEPLNVLSADNDQKKAAEMISQKAVVVMSGRGGCGKTEVVSRVCKVALAAYYDIIDKQYSSYIQRIVNEHISRANAEQRESSLSQETAAGAEKMAACAGEVVGGACLAAEKLEMEEEVEAEIKGEKVGDRQGKTIDETEDEASLSDESSQSQGDLFDSSCDEEDFTSVLPKAETSVDNLVSEDVNDFTFSSEMSSGDFSSLDTEGEETTCPIPDKTMKSYILLTAPTAKAAKVLGNRTGFKGYTIHQIMFRYLLWLRELPPREPFPFKDVAILVVDECSLVAVNNISFLLYILKSHSNLQRVILLGDLQQLPSIEPGNFLPDVYASLKEHGCAIKLRTNHRAEGRLIIENAIRISARCMPTFDSKQAFTYIQLTDKQHMELERDEAVQQLISTEEFKSDRLSQFVAFRRLDCEAINNICSKAYTGHICIDSSTKRSVFHEGFKICCSKNGTVQVVILHDPNNEAKDHIAPKVDLLTQSDGSSTLTEENAEKIRDEEAASKRQEFIREKIDRYIAQAQRQSEVISGEDIETQVKLDDTLLSQKRERDNGKPAMKSCSMRLCNGELFWIKSIFTQPAIPPQKFDKEKWIIESEDGMTLSVYRSALMKECRMKPSWCRTIHTFQGSEINHLAYVLGETGRQNWQHVYTAVTRGKYSVTIIGEDSCLRKAISASCKERLCSLKEKLSDKLPSTTETIHEPGDVMYSISPERVWGDVTSPPTTSISQKKIGKKRKLEINNRHHVDHNSQADVFTQMDEWTKTFQMQVSSKVTEKKDFEVVQCEPAKDTASNAIVLVPVLKNSS